MIFKEVQLLRKQGNLSEAYAISKNAYVSNPKDQWAKKALLLCIYDQLRNFSMFDTRDDFYAKLCELKDINPDFTDISWNLTAYPIADIIRDTIQNDNDVTKIEQYYNLLFNLIKDFPYTKPSREYSILLNSFINLSRKWGNLFDFITWWNFANLRQDDFEVKYFPDNKPIRPLAERASITCAWEIISNNVGSLSSLYRDGTNSCIKLMDNLFLRKIPSTASSQKQNLWFLQARLHMLSDDIKNAIEVLVRFFEKNGYSCQWALTLLADIIGDNKIRTACYCKLFRMFIDDDETIETIKMKKKFIELLMSDKKIDVAKYVYSTIRDPKNTPSDDKGNLNKLYWYVHKKFKSALRVGSAGKGIDVSVTWDTEKKFIITESESIGDYIHTLKL